MLRIISHLIACLWIATTFASEVVKVSIGELTFKPADVTVHVGDEVEWVNGDFVTTRRQPRAATGIWRSPPERARLWN